MSRRFALLILVAVCLTATMAQAQPDWWSDFDDKGDGVNGNVGGEKEPFSFDDPEWWPDLPDFSPKLDWLPRI